MDFNVPGLERGTLIAAFSGAVAYLCTQDKMPVIRALGYVVAGGIAAAYIGPGIVEVAADRYQYTLGEKAKYAAIFLTGVGGIWILNIVISILKAIQERVGTSVNRFFERVFGQEKKP